MRTRLSRDRVGDETLPLVRSRGMRACLSWDRVEMNPASREIEPRPIVFPAPFRQGSSVQLRVLQRRSSVRGNASFGTVAGTSEPVALKSPGAGSSLLSSKGFSATAGPAKCTDSHRQHVCGFIHKSLRESGGGSVRQSENTHCLLFFTPRWPAASPYAFPPIKECYRWCYERSGWSEHQGSSSPWIQPGFPDLTELLEAPPCRSPAGNICYPRSNLKL